MDDPAALTGLRPPLAGVPVDTQASHFGNVGVGASSIYFAGDSGFPRRGAALTTYADSPADVALHSGAAAPADKPHAILADADVLTPAALADDNYGTFYAAIGRHFGPFDLALLPIGAYLPRHFLGPQHISPSEAVAAHVKLRAAHSAGIHWGTFILGAERVIQPREDVAQAAAIAGVTTFVTPAHGATMIYDRQARTAVLASGTQ